MTRAGPSYCVDGAKGIYVLRLVIGRPPGYFSCRTITFSVFPGGLTPATMRRVVPYGPGQLPGASCRGNTTRTQLHLRVINMPWLNRFDRDWLSEVLFPCANIYVVEDHSPIGGLGDHLLNACSATGLIPSRGFKKFGVEGSLACGTPQEALQHHGLDGASLARKILAQAD